MSPVFALTWCVFLLARHAPPPQHTNFSGRWVLNRSLTRLQYPSPASVDSGLVEIEHQGRKFSFVRRFFMHGAPDTVSYRLQIGDSAVVTRNGSREERLWLQWLGNELLFVDSIVAPQGVASDSVRYGLGDHGKVLYADERFHAPRLSYRNLWVFDRR